LHEQSHIGSTLKMIDAGLQLLQNAHDPH
jgi:hypothetical protein